MKPKTYEQQKESIWFYRTIAVLLIVFILLVALYYETINDSLTRQLTAQVKAHETLTIKYDSLNRDVISETCLLRSQL